MPGLGTTHFKGLRRTGMDDKAAARGQGTPGR